jgi:hypothetical protein
MDKRQRGPRAIANLAAMIEDQSNDVVVMFKEESGLPFELRLDSGIVPTLIAALMALASRSGAESPMATASQPVTITSAQMLLGPKNALRPEARLRHALDAEIVDREQAAAEHAVAGEARQRRLRHRGHEQDVEIGAAEITLVTFLTGMSITRSTLPSGV